MKIIILFVVWIFNTSASGAEMTALQLKLDKDYPLNTAIMESCLKGVPSTDPAVGCVASLGYITQICRLKGSVDFKKMYLRRQEIYSTKACKLLEESFTGRSISFFDLDAKTCRKGFNSLGDRLVTLHKSKDFIDEEYFYWYEEKSCKDYRRYVYLCEYIDGGLKIGLPNKNRKLPKIDFSTNQESYCLNKSDAISVMGKDLLGDYKTYTQDIYEKAVLAARSRMPASAKVSQECEQIRNSYYNFNCQRFEKIDLEKDDLPPVRKADDKKDKNTLTDDTHSK